MNEAKMGELTQAEDMAYFRTDICLYFARGAASRLSRAHVELT